MATWDWLNGCWIGAGPSSGSYDNPNRVDKILNEIGRKLAKEAKTKPVVEAVLSRPRRLRRK